jgi:hypothetical protein
MEKFIQCSVCGMLILSITWAEVGLSACHKCKQEELDPHPIHHPYFSVSSSNLTYMISATTSTFSANSIVPL